MHFSEEIKRIVGQGWEEGAEKITFLEKG